MQATTPLDRRRHISDGITSKSRINPVTKLRSISLIPTIRIQGPDHDSDQSKESCNYHKQISDQTYNRPGSRCGTHKRKPRTHYASSNGSFTRNRIYSNIDYLSVENDDFNNLLYAISNLYNTIDNSLSNTTIEKLNKYMSASYNLITKLRSTRAKIREQDAKNESLPYIDRTIKSLDESSVGSTSSIREALGQEDTTYSHYINLIKPTFQKVSKKIVSNLINKCNQGLQGKSNGLPLSSLLSEISKLYFILKYERLPFLKMLLTVIIDDTTLARQENFDISNWILGIFRDMILFEILGQKRDEQDGHKDMFPYEKLILEPIPKALSMVLDMLVFSSSDSLDQKERLAFLNLEGLVKNLLNVGKGEPFVAFIQSSEPTPRQELHEEPEAEITISASRQRAESPNSIIRSVSPTDPKILRQNSLKLLSPSETRDLTRSNTHMNSLASLPSDRDVRSRQASGGYYSKGRSETKCSFRSERKKTVRFDDEESSKFLQVQRRSKTIAGTSK